MFYFEEAACVRFLERAGRVDERMNEYPMSVDKPRGASPVGPAE
jgi:hypothetical protein